MAGNGGHQSGAGAGRIVRGTGPRGLAGMPARRPLAPGITLARPMLLASRAGVLDYLRSIDQPYREDPTNSDRARTRARIRHDLLPKLAAEYNPQVVSAILSMARLAQQAPGRSVEVRVPPYAAVQVVPGVRHTRGTPPAVIELDAATWIDLATGVLSWAEASAQGRVRASGERADLTAYLPLAP